ncbi:MAG: FAD-dependent oxidoreductase [Candidatus Scalindua sp.]|nr:FAD-dependent oxidoreductase [Candidatus Scalindua sp.]
MKDFDLTVIGGGAGGLNVASGAIQLGARVALVEKNKLGGDCLYYGCVPTKALVRSAKAALLIKRSKEYGLNDTDISFDFKNIMTHMREVISKIGVHDDPKRKVRIRGLLKSSVRRRVKYWELMFLLRRVESYCTNLQWQCRIISGWEVLQRPYMSIPPCLKR